MYTVVDGASDDIVLKREEASQFFRRAASDGIIEECFVEGCDWEEIREFF